MTHYNTNECFFQYTFANNLFICLHIVTPCVNRARIYLYNTPFICIFVCCENYK